MRIFSPAIAQKSLLYFIDVFFSPRFFYPRKKDNFLHKNINYKKYALFYISEIFFKY